MVGPIKVMDCELSQPLKDIEELSGYIKLKLLVRLHQRPIGYVDLPVYGDRCPASEISKAILEQHSWKIMCELVYRGLTKPVAPDGLKIEDLLQLQPSTFEGPEPIVTVAVCTRDRTDDLAICLDSLQKLEYPAVEILVVDNAPSNQKTKKLVTTKYPDVRYVVEPRPGLDWARNRAILEAKGEIIAYTDDDVVVDAHWATALAQLFAENENVMAATGLVVPYELETDAQITFEMYGGFGRGFERIWCRRDEHAKYFAYHIGAGSLGTGANMAFRRSLFTKIGIFDPALDVGTVTNGGGDLDMYYRTIQEGHTLVYEPAAIVRHRHRREYKKLREQIANNGIALYAYFVRNAIHYPKELKKIVYFGIWWFFRWQIRRLLASFFRPSVFPRDLIFAEFFGVFKGLFRYHQARCAAESVDQIFGPMTPAKMTEANPKKKAPVKKEAIATSMENEKTVGGEQ